MGVEKELNLSTENIMSSLNHKIKRDKYKKVFRKVTAVAVAMAIVAIGVKIADVITHSGRDKIKTLNSSSTTDILSYDDNTFFIKVYAGQQNGQTYDVKNGNSVSLVNNSSGVYYSTTNGTSDMVIRLPIRCEGANIESVIYQFESNSTIFVRDYEFPEEFNDYIGLDSLTGDEERARYDFMFAKYCDENNLLHYISKSSNDERARGYQKMENIYNVAYEDQYKVGLNFMVSQGAINSKEVLERQVLRVTANKRDGSSATKRYGFEVLSSTNGDVSSVKIYEME